MKKTILFTALCVACTLLHGQSYWSLSGNSASSSSFIGTNAPQAKLTVDGNICAKEVRVSLSGSPCWPDYVFANDYDLMKISDLKKYIQDNSHLPGIPSAAEVEGNGVELGATTELLLQKIEEMTLYIIQLEERIQQLENKKGGDK